MPPKPSPELQEAINEVKSSTGPSAQDKILIALVDLAWPEKEPEKPAIAPA